MYYYNNELPPQQGWICPKCGRVNAPWMPTCDCVSRYLVKTSSTSRGSHEVADTPQTDIHGLTDCDFCKEKNCEDCEGGKDEPQTD